MTESDRIEYASLLKEEGFQCSCGRVHRAGVKTVKLGGRALDELPEVLRMLHVKKPMVVSGPFTFPAAGQPVLKRLDENGIPYSVFVLEKNGPDKLQPDDGAVEQVCARFDPSCDVILAVGSGSLNDICKGAATKLGVLQLTVGTAPSMDGYVSASASLEVRKTKATVPTNPPAAVICDTRLMEKAPMRLLWAGVGDMAAKVTALGEWKIVSVLFGEHYCETIAKMVRRAIDQTFAGAEKLLSRDPDAVRTMGEGLVLSGLCMNFEGTSRPASGLDHYFSHCWEMMKIAHGEPYDLHGIYVGIGTLIELRLMEKLLTYRPDRERLLEAAAGFDPEAWKNRLFRLFGDTAEGFVRLAEQTQNNALKTRLAHFDAIEEKWDDVCEILKQTLEEGRRLEPAMERLGMPLRPKDVGFTGKEVRETFIVTRDVRDKYLLSSLIWDLGLADEFADWLEREYA